jgi:uncharacterized membrane protein YjjB (DUF3815 family)
VSNAIRTVLTAVLVAGVGYGAYLYFLKRADFYVASVLISAAIRLMGWGT